MAQAPLPFAEGVRAPESFEATKARDRRVTMMKCNVAHRSVKFCRRMAEWDGLPNGA